MRVSRRQFVAVTAGLGLLAGCERLPWQAQPPPKLPRIGTMSGASLNPTTEGYTEAFRQGLRDLGYVPGQTVGIEYRFADGEAERLPGIGAELASLPVDIIVAAGDVPIRAAKEAGSAIPIVMVASRDPVGNGLVASLARPGGNVTGLSAFTDPLTGKRLELLKQTVPSISRVAALGAPASLREFQEAEPAASILGVRLQHLEISGPDDFGPAFELAVRERLDAVLVLVSPLTVPYATAIAALSVAHKLPATFDRREFVESGGLLAYGPSIAGQWRRAAYYVDRILKGTKPADLPVEQPMTFDFVVNLKTAAALGITFPNEIMLQVTEVIE